MEILTVVLFFLLCSFLVMPFFVLLRVIYESISRSVMSMIWKRLEDHFPWPFSSEFLLHHHGDSTEPFMAPPSFDHVKWVFDGEHGTRLYKRGAVTAEGEQAVRCVFCLCDVEDGDEVRELRCEHLFHRSCLDRWVGYYGRTSCPLCRKSLASNVAEAELPCEDGVDQLQLGTATLMLAVDPYGAW